MLEVVIIFLFLSLVLYVLLGGADFGAGIVEFFLKKNKSAAQREIIGKAIGPIWEANHMWLIIIVVILFMGFPDVYSQVSIFLHIPLTCLLVGIVLRGTAFTFRHYDAIKDESQKYYNLIFKYSSLWTSFFFGVVAGALTSQRINPQAINFLDLYVLDWFNLFSIMTGLFTVCIFGFLASVYLIGETNDEDTKKYFIRVGRKLLIAMVVSGGLVFLTSEITSAGLTQRFLDHPFAIITIILTTISLPVLWRALKKEKVLLSRLTAGFQVTMVVLTWVMVYSPYMLIYKNGTGLNLYQAAAPTATITNLAWALLIGSCFILPSLFYLYKVFKSRPTSETNL
ncbi:MAG TPA: cytochrome d ubiquinol oxidase subunit II [Ignavibacteria bacterium]|nr:cytochrome d ubiquinol oxidase subunit II [Ignavibacteria bacterium]